MPSFKRYQGEWLNVVTATIREHRYTLVYPPYEYRQALRQIGAWASDPRLDFNWLDVGQLSQEVMRLRDKQAGVAR